MVTTFTYKPSLVRIDAHNFQLIVVSAPHTQQTHPHTDRTDYNTLRRSFASAQCNKLLIKAWPARYNYRILYDDNCVFQNKMIPIIFVIILQQTKIFKFPYVISKCTSQLSFRELLLFAPVLNAWSQFWLFAGQCKSIADQRKLAYYIFWKQSGDLRGWWVWLVRIKLRTRVTVRVSGLGLGLGLGFDTQDHPACV